ncbi:MAG: DUF2892 domain-containing protein [Armatimonadota bacterium]|nr:DUF2892 domain-containing protein [Armatimonadota bacterium]
MAETNGKEVNVASWERWTSAIGGGALATYGALRRDKVGIGLAALGAALLYRGSTGHCPAYHAAGVSTAPTKSPERQNKPTANSGNSVQGPKGVQNEQGIKVHKAVTIGKPAQELYDFWRNFANLPQFMTHLQSVEVKDSKTSHWVAKAPFGRTVQWDAEIINEDPGKLIAWRSLPGADVDSSGSVRFVPAPQGRGTEVHVTLSYQPPAGQLGAAIAKLFGEEPSQQIDNDLRHFRNLMETGEIPTTEGQPTGKRNAGAKVVTAMAEAKLQKNAG